MGEPKKSSSQYTGDKQPTHQKLQLQLFVAGASPNSERAIVNLVKICDTYFTDQYSLEIIDVYQQPEVAKTEQLVALPLLIKRYPLPEKRLIGDLSDIKKVLQGLGQNT